MTKIRFMPSSLGATGHQPPASRPSVCLRILVAAPVACPDDTRAATRAATPMYYLEQAHTSSDENGLVSRGTGRTRTASSMAEAALNPWVQGSSP
jgi:hypothetical protein